MYVYISITFKGIHELIHIIHVYICNMCDHTEWMHGLKRHGFELLDRNAIDMGYSHWKWKTIWAKINHPLSLVNIVT